MRIFVILVIGFLFLYYFLSNRDKKTSNEIATLEVSTTTFPIPEKIIASEIEAPVAVRVEKESSIEVASPKLPTEASFPNKKKLTFLDPFPESRAFQWYFNKETTELGTILKPKSTNSPVEFVGQMMLEKISQLKENDVLSVEASFFERMTELDPNSQGVFYQNQQGSLDRFAAQFNSSLPICFLKANAVAIKETDLNSKTLISLHVARVLNLKEFTKTDLGYRIEFQTKIYKIDTPVVQYIDCFLPAESPKSLQYSELAVVHLYAALGIKGNFRKREF